MMILIVLIGKKAYITYHIKNITNLADLISL